MPHDIIDNRTDKVIDHIRRILPGSQSARFAVGYFFLSGLEAVADQLANVQELRLLIGNTSSRETIEQIAEGYRRLEQVQEAVEALAFPRRLDMALAAEATAANIGQTAALLDQTDQAEQLVSTLVRLIEEGRLKVRVFTKGRLHAKAYIFDYGPIYDAQGDELPREEQGLAIVGSSNFTLSGVTSNTELNVLVHGNANHAELSRWFDDLWADAQDFEAHLMQELRCSWPLAQVTPYEIYLKTLYELVRDQLEGADAARFLWRDDITAVLTEFQEQAVRRAVQMIERYGGCYRALRRLLCGRRGGPGQILHRRGHRQTVRAPRPGQAAHRLPRGPGGDVGALQRGLPAQRPCPLDGAAARRRGTRPRVDAAR